MPRTTRVPLSDEVDRRCHLSWHVSPDHPSEATWLLWIKQDGEGNGSDRLWAGRVKLQDDVVATTERVFNDAMEKLQSWLSVGVTQRGLF